jgi:RND family efflux transporter MFP subunit
MSTRVFVLVHMFVLGCTSSEPAPPTEKEPTPTVEAVKVRAQKLDTTTRLPAEIYAYESVALYPRVNGFVDEVLVDRGNNVKRGQLLVRLSAPELSAQRAEAASKLAAAQSTFERMKAAAETPGAVAKHDLEVAEAGQKAEEARLASLKTLEGYLYVRAPFDGTITERNVHPGALVGPAAGASSPPMLKMESVGHLRITVAVPETDAGAIADGANAEFAVRTWPGVKFSGAIRRVAHAIDMRTRTMPVELDYANKDGKLAPGMFAEVTWPVRRDAPSLFVPSTAVVQTTDKTYVDRIKDGVVEQLPVKRGVTLKDAVEVFAGGLVVDDLVMKRGSEELKPGTKVNVK